MFSRLQHYGEIPGQPTAGPWFAFPLARCARCGLTCRGQLVPLDAERPHDKAAAAGFKLYPHAADLPPLATGGICGHCAGWARTSDDAIHLDEIVTRTAWIRGRWAAGDALPDPFPDLVWTGQEAPPRRGEAVTVADALGAQARGRVAGLEVDRGRVFVRVTLDQRDPDARPDAVPPRFDGLAVARAARESGAVEGTSAIAATVERVWKMIQEQHPNIDAVAVSIKTGNRSRARGRDAMTWGHFASNRWTRRSDGSRVHELMIAGELLALGGAEVLSTVLHEAAHALAHAEGIKDTSRGGRYHNAHFKAIAERVGLDVAKSRHGWNVTTVRPDTANRYRDAVALLDDVCELHAVGGWARKHAPGPVEGEPDDQAGDVEPEPEPEDKPRRGPLTLVCQCPDPRKIRVSRAVAEGPPIRCEACGEPFSERPAAD